MISVERQQLSPQREYGLLRQLLIFTGLFTITAVGVYITFALCGETLLRYIDGLYQNYPLLVKAQEIGKALFEGKGFSFWDWNLGLGVDSISTYESRLFNPLALLAACFPIKYLDIGYSFAVVLGDFLAGISFFFFSRKLGHNSEQTMIGALCYAFSGWVIYSGSYQLNFLTAAILLPILILGVEKILKKDSPITFIVAVGVSLILSFYWSYMSGIIVLLYFCLRYFYYNDSKIFGFIRAFVKFIGYGIVGIVLSAPVLLPRILLIFNATTESGAGIDFSYSLKTYLLFITGLFTGEKVTASYSFIGISALCIVLLPIIFRKLKQKNIASIFFFICIIMAIIPFFGSMFNGFSYVTGRWLYIFAFFFVWAAIECYSEEYLSNKRSIYLMGLCFVFLSVYSLLVYQMLSGATNVSSELQMIITCVAGICFLIAFLCTSKIKEGKRRVKIRNRIILAILIINIISVYNIEFGIENTTQDNDFVDASAAWKKFEAAPQRVISALEQNDFYRVDQVNGVRRQNTAGNVANEGLYYNYKPVNIYQSTLNSNWTKFNVVLANSCGNFFRSVSFSNDNRPGMDLLLGVEYFIGNELGRSTTATQYAGFGFEPYKTIDGVEVFKNKYSIGLGATYTQYLNESELEKLSPIEREFAMLQAAVIPDEQIKHVEGVKHCDLESFDIDVPEIKYQVNQSVNVELGKNEIQVKEANGKIVLDIGSIKNKQIMLSFEDLQPKVEPQNLRITTQLDDIKKVAISAEGSSFGLANVENYIVNLGYFENTSGNIEISFNRPGKLTYGDIKVYAVPMQQYEKAAQKLAKDRYQIQHFGNDYIKGSVNLKDDGVAYFSIPDQVGWDVYIDGKKAQKIDNVNIAFTGVHVSAGTHTIELKYTCVGMKYGKFIFMAGLVLIFIIAWRFRRNGVLD